MKGLIIINFVFFTIPLFAQTNLNEGYKQVNGIEIFYQSLGAGEPLVVMHGGPGMDGSYFHPFIDPLAETFHIINFDQRASGKSTGLSDTLMLNADQLVEDIEGLRKAFGDEKIHLMGHSWGGQLAMRYAINYPDRLYSLILVSTGGADASVAASSSENIMNRFSPEDKEAYLKMLSENYWDSKKGLDEILKIMWKPFVVDQDKIKLIKDAYSDNTSYVQKHIGKSTQGYNLYEQLSTLEIPTLLIHGDYDPIPLEAIEKIHKTIAGSKMVVLKDCGHFPFIEKQDEFIKTIIDFMKSLK